MPGSLPQRLSSDPLIDDQFRVWIFHIFDEPLQQTEPTQEIASHRPNRVALRVNVEVDRFVISNTKTRDRKLELLVCPVREGSVPLLYSVVGADSNPRMSFLGVRIG